MGGGLYLDGATTLTSVEISENNAKYGGGITFSGGNNRRIGNINAGTVLTNNNANLYGGGIYMAQGVLNINNAEIYGNTIEELDGLSAPSHSDVFSIQKGQMYINGGNFDGSIYKADSATIYLKSALLKYNEESNIYIDFVNDGNDKTLFTGSNYQITSDDLNTLNLIDSSSGELNLNSESSGNSVIFSPQTLTVAYARAQRRPPLVSLLEENDEQN